MPTTRKINNWTVAGGTSKDSDDLKSLYFQETESGSGQYNLYGTVNGLPDQVITTNPPTLLGGGDINSFTFHYGSPCVKWTVTNFFIGHAGMGHWSNPYHEGRGDDSGTFVAQAGGTTVEDPVEDASAASA